MYSLSPEDYPQNIWETFEPGLSKPRVREMQFCVWLWLRPLPGDRGGISQFADTGRLNEALAPFHPLSLPPSDVAALNYGQLSCPGKSSITEDSQEWTAVTTDPRSGTQYVLGATCPPMLASLPQQ